MCVGFYIFHFHCPIGQVPYHPEGYACVREYGNPDDADNPTLVWTWRKELAAKMCQPCSDREGRIVDLSENGCTKRFCEKKLAENAENAENAPEFIFTICLHQPKSSGFQLKKASKASIVRDISLLT